MHQSPRQKKPAALTGRQLSIVSPHQRLHSCLLHGLPSLAPLRISIGLTVCHAMNPVQSRQNNITGQFIIIKETLLFGRHQPNPLSQVIERPLVFAKNSAIPLICNRMEISGDQREQCAFPCTIRAENRYPLTRLNLKGKVIKYLSVSPPDRDASKLNYRCLHIA